MRSNSFKFFAYLYSITFFLILFRSNNLFSREAFEFSYGNKVSILSDKAFRKKEGDLFETIGNVVITHGGSTLYGEKATLSLATGEVTVIGNVRFIGNNMTLYGSELNYNFKTELLELKNSRIIAENYNILGKTITRTSPSVIVATEAEYTTCRDCPESWTIYGKRVHVTVGDYVRIEHAFVKAKGVIVMYFPYIIFPIKKERESGLLFPKLSFDVKKNGATFQQPWFGAISDSTDVTITPSVFGRRGMGSEFQYRQMFGENKWIELNNLNSIDRIYLPEKVDDQLSGDHYHRVFANFEQHFNFGNSVNHHFYYNGVRDLDIVRDYDSFVKNEVKGSHVGGGGFVEASHSLFNFSVESHFNRNQLVDNPKEFDHSYVQILPKVTLSTTRFSLIRTDFPLLRELYWGVDSDFTIFRQNHFDEPTYIRNTKRINANPFLTWDIGSYGPIRLQSTATMEYQEYRFPYEERDTRYKKQNFLYMSEASFEIEKIYGIAFRDRVLPEDVDWEKYADKQFDKNREKLNSDIIGDLPDRNETLVPEKLIYDNFSYRHGQIFKLIHYYTTDQKRVGNEQFEEQIQKDEGRFDSYDSFRDKKDELLSATTSTGIPTLNTVELQWKNSIVRKQVRDDIEVDLGVRPNKDFYSYKQISYFNLSQGYQLDSESTKLTEKLTRLALDTGLNFDTTTLSLSDYYIYVLQKHVASLGISKTYGQNSVSANLTYNAIPSSIRKFLTFRGEFVPLDIIELSLAYDYDFENELVSENRYNIGYRPLNNCWVLDFSYAKSQIESRYSLNFNINYNSKAFFGSK